MTPIYVVDHLGSPIGCGESLTAPRVLPRFDEAVLAAVLQRVLSERLPSGLPAETELTDIIDEWLVIDCCEPDCSEYTVTDIQPADPVHDDPPLRAVLDGRGWTSDREGRDLCPPHSR